VVGASITGDLSLRRALQSRPPLPDYGCRASGETCAGSKRWPCAARQSHPLRSGSGQASIRCLTACGRAGWAPLLSAQILSTETLSLVSHLSGAGLSVPEAESHLLQDETRVPPLGSTNRQRQRATAVCPASASSGVSPYELNGLPPPRLRPSSCGQCHPDVEAARRSYTV
jgi:hypothetical protein